MSKALFVLLAAILFRSVPASAQISEMECTVYRRYNVYMTVTPVHWDESVLPKAGSKVHLLLLITNNLPEGKSPGYYELFTMETVKTVPEIKSITFKADSNLEDAKQKIGFSTLTLTKGSKVKIAW